MRSEEPCVLLISPERGLTHLLNLELNGARIATSTARSFAEARSVVLQTPSLLIVDSQLLRTQRAVHEMEALRTDHPGTPAFLLLSEFMDRAHLWRFDVDDYIVLPASASCIRLRVKALLRMRANGEAPSPMLRWGDALTIDVNQRHAIVAGTQIRLSRAEWRMLQVLAMAHGSYIATHQLLMETWGSQDVADQELLAAMVARLRRCLSANPKASPIILGDTRRGYALAAAYPRKELEYPVRR